MPAQHEILDIISDLIDSVRTIQNHAEWFIEPSFSSRANPQFHQHNRSFENENSVFLLVQLLVQLLLNCTWEITLGFQGLESVLRPRRTRIPVTPVSPNLIVWVKSQMPSNIVEWCSKVVWSMWFVRLSTYKNDYRLVSNIINLYY